MADLVQTLADIPTPQDAPMMGVEERKMRVAQALADMKAGSDYSPIRSWTQGLARVADAAYGGWQLRRLNQEERDQRAEAMKLYSADPRLATADDATQPSRAATALADVGPSTVGTAATYGAAPASIRNNNPGAMWPGPSSAAYGSSGSQNVAGNNRIATFPDPISGAAAQFDLLKKNYSGMSMADAIKKWSGGNNADAYTNNVVKATGLLPDTVITPELLQSPQGISLARAMAQHEAGQAYPLTPQQWAQAQKRVFKNEFTPEDAARITGGAVPTGAQTPWTPVGGGFNPQDFIGRGAGNSASASPATPTAAPTALPGMQGTPITPPEAGATPGAPPPAPAPAQAGAVPPAPIMGSSAGPGPGIAPGTPGRVPTQMTPGIVQQIRRLQDFYARTGDPAALKQAQDLTTQYSKPIEYKFQVVGDQLVRTSPNGGSEVIMKDIKDPNSIQDLKYAHQNWKEYGLPDPASSDPQARQFWRQLAGQRLGGITTMIDQRAPDEFEKEYGGGMAKQALDTIHAGNAAVDQGRKIQLAQKMLQDVQTGKITPATATIGGWMQAIGINPAQFGINPSTPMTAEALTALSNEMALGKIGAGGMPANNFSDADRKFLQQTVTSLADRPEANFMKLEMARRVSELQVDKANAWADARENGTSYEKFDQQWRREMRHKDVFGDLIDQAKAFGSQPGQQGGPIDQEQMKKGLDQQFGGAAKQFTDTIKQFGGDYNAARKAAIKALIRQNPDLVKELQGNQ